MRAAPALWALPPNANPAQELTWDLQGADPWSRAWVHSKLSRVPDGFSLEVATRFRELWDTAGEGPANLYLLDVTDRVAAVAIDPRSSDDDLIALGKSIAFQCRELLHDNLGHATTARRLLGICNRYGIRPPKGLVEYGTVTGTAIVTGERSIASEPAPALSIGIVARLTDDVWWRKRLRVAHGRILEAEAIHLHQVHRYAGLYVSDATFDRYLQQCRRNARALDALVAENELGEELRLSEIVLRSLANPANRRAELMVRLYGFEQVAIELGHVAMFLTVTCPSRMHAHLGKSGTENPNFDQHSTPRLAQQYLTKLWSRIRAKWQRLGLRPYGFRITEAHHDGTPHWHILLFIEQENRAALIDVVRKYALQDSPDEPGANEHRFSVEAIDRSKGSATGYVAKYISKNIDGFGLEQSGKDGQPQNLARRMGAWASTWGIRQFQQIGGPPVGLWRELRRISGMANEATLIGQLAAAADEGSWAGFVKLLGGPQKERKANSVRVHKVFDARLGCYGEPIGLRAAGITVGNVVFPTRIHTWTIMRKPASQNCTVATVSDLPTTSMGKFSLEAVGSSPPWSSVNNCTEATYRASKKCYLGARGHLI